MLEHAASEASGYEALESEASEASEYEAPGDEALESEASEGSENEALGDEAPGGGALEHVADEAREYVEPERAAFAGWGYGAFRCVANAAL